MSLLLKAFPHGRPRPHAHRSTPVRALVPSVALATVIALVASFVLVALPLAGSADATRHHAHHAKHAAKKRAATKKAARKAHTKARPPRVLGQPARNYVIPQGPLFSFPNKNATARLAIRDRVLYTVQSVWGGHLDRYDAPLPTNGTHPDGHVVLRRLADGPRARRGQEPWRERADRRGQERQPRTTPRGTGCATSWARTCSALATRTPTTPGASRASAAGRAGACVGTAHAKYFLFDNVGAAHARTISVQTSMNLTTFAFAGQWNQAQVSHAPSIYEDFYAIFRQARLGRPQPQPYHVRSMGHLRRLLLPALLGHPGPRPRLPDPQRRPVHRRHRWRDRAHPDQRGPVRDLR